MNAQGTYVTHQHHHVPSATGGVTYMTSYQPQPGYAARYTVRWPRCIKGLSWTKLLFSSAIIILWILGIAISANQTRYESIIVGIDGTGIWLGAFMVVTAVMGILAVKRANKCFLIAYLVMAIIGTFAALVVFSMSTVWAALAGQDHLRYDNGEWAVDATPSPGMQATSGFEAIAALLAFIYAILAIIGSSFACCGVCNCCGGNSQDDNTRMVQIQAGPSVPASAPVGPVAAAYPPFNPNYTVPGAAPQAPYPEPGYAPPPPYSEAQSLGEKNP